MGSFCFIYLFVSCGEITDEYLVENKTKIVGNMDNINQPAVTKLVIDLACLGVREF